MVRSRAAIVAWQLAILVIVLSVWEGWDVARKDVCRSPGSRRSSTRTSSRSPAIWRSFLKLGCLSDKAGFVACYQANANNLWLATLVTLKNMCWGFLWARASAS